MPRRVALWKATVDMRLQVILSCLNRSKSKMTSSHQTDLQTFEKDYKELRVFGLNYKLVMHGDGSIDVRLLSPLEMANKAKAKAKMKMKDRANLMAKLADAMKKKEVKLADAKKKEDAEFAELISKLDMFRDDQNGSLLEPNLTWEQKVAYILDMVRCRELTEYNHKLQCHAHTRFCSDFNIAFFDLDKESKGNPWKPMDKIPSPRPVWLADSVNVIAIKVAESDRDYPISVFGTVLARDQYDYRCVYLFKRGRDDPQVINSEDDTLTLMGPYRALAVRDDMYFEFHLKVKGDGYVDEDLSKGVIVHSAVRHTKQLMTQPLYSCLSTVKLVYTYVPCAVEVSFAVSILKGPSDFINKVTAWTTGNEENKIPVYNKEGVGVGRGGSVVHGLVVVPEDEELVLRVCVSEHCEHEPGKCFQLTLWHDINELIARQESCELQVKISWRGVMNFQENDYSWGRPNMFCYFGGTKILL